MSHDKTRAVASEARIHAVSTAVEFQITASSPLFASCTYQNGLVVVQFSADYVGGDCEAYAAVIDDL